MRVHTEAALVKKAAHGNPEAFSALIREQQAYLYKIAYKETENEQDALDAVQESILKAYRGLHSLRDPALFTTWITRIVINTARDILRGRKREGSGEDSQEEAAPEVLSPEEKMDLYAALERLPSKQRQVVALKYFEGMGIRQIAAKTGMPEGTVSVYLRRAVQALREDLKEAPAQPGERKPLCQRI